MADKLIVRDFGPIRNAELDIKKTTVLIGPQGSGKSTLAKLVATATNMSWHIKVQEDYDLNDHFSDYGILGFIEDASFFQYYQSEIEVTFDNRKSTTATNAKLSVNNFFIKNTELEKLIISFENNEISEKNRNIKILELVYRSIYIPSERMILPIVRDASLSLQLNRIPVQESLLYFGSEFEIARKKVSSLRTLLDGVSYQFENGKDVVISDGKHFDLSQTASGFQALIPMQIIVENISSENKRRFIVEEPELNLYPPAQKKLIGYLVSKCSKKDNQLLLTTHSPYVLSSLNNLLFAYKVAQKHPEQAEEVAKIIPKESWLNPDEFAAYFVADGTVRSIISPITGLIAENELDGVSEDIGDEFNALMEIYRTKNETSH